VGLTVRTPTLGVCRVTFRRKHRRSSKNCRTFRSETALDELDDIDEDTTMYREVGELLVKTEFDEARDDLEEKVSNLEVRVETLEKQEQRVQEQFEDLQGELQQMLGGGPAGGPGAGA
jgi:prefoldin beta subunit